MLRSVHSPPDPHEEHLRHLLDQRTTRADLHTRFPSLSEFSDTPSIYSRGFFSPNPSEKPHMSNSPSIRHCGPPRPRSPLNEHHTPVTDRERLNDPAASILDLDDDPRASFASAASPNHQEPSTDASDDEDQFTSRMSLLGPKMRFHSRAPWEIGEDGIEEEDDSDNSAGYISIAAKQSRVKLSKTDGIKRGLGFGNSYSRSSSASRPSGESSRSQGVIKKSFESTSSPSSSPYRALHSLAQASVSSSSLGPPPPIASSNLRGKLLTTRPMLNTSFVSTHSSPLPSPSFPHEPQFSRKSSGTPVSPSSFSTRSPSPSSDVNDEEVHPYANPELVVSYDHDPPPHSPLREAFTFSTVARSNSNVTVTSSPTRSSIQKQGVHDYPSPREQKPPNRGSAIHGKEISSPISISGSPLRSADLNSLNGKYKDLKVNSLVPPTANGLAGWQRCESPSFTLISLEEARAQRIRSATSNATPSNQSTSPVSSTRLFPFPDADRETTRSPGNRDDRNSVASSASRSRARSISTGAKAKSALQSFVAPAAPKFERRESEPSTSEIQAVGAAKPLRHRKSGFMRIFGSKEKEKDVEKEREKDSPPPIPTTSQPYTTYQPQPRPPRLSPSRVPVPSLTPSLLQEPSSISPISEGSNEATHSLGHGKKTHPLLSINTSSHPPSPLAGSSLHSRASPASMFDNEKTWGPPVPELPQSAPPIVTEFPALKLRPISTTFSAQFTEHIGINHSAGRDSGNSLDSDCTSAQTPSTAMSPITPASSKNLLNQFTKSTMPVISEEQSSVILALQDQILSAKKAWQQHIWELEGQIRDLKAEVEDLRVTENHDYCAACGRGKPLASEEPAASLRSNMKPPGVVNRPRARTGTSSRFGSGI